MRLVYAILPIILTWPQLGFAQKAELSTGVAGLSDCAQICLTTALVNSPCELADRDCSCTNVGLMREAQHCLLSTCTLKETLAAKNATATFCEVPVRNNSTTMRVSNIILSVVAVACVLLRIGFKVFEFGFSELGLDDYTVIATMLLGVPTVVIIDRGIVPNGLGTDVWAVPFDNITKFLFWLYVLSITYCVLIAMVKLTLLFFFLRIFPKPVTRKLLWATIAFDIVYGVTFAFATIFSCHPISNYWAHWDTYGLGQCINVFHVAWANSIISIILDLWMLALPLYEVFNLQLSMRDKISVAIMFLVGTFVTVVSILRLHSIIPFGDLSNPTWDGAANLHWSNIEISVGIICACMPAIRKMFAHMFPKVLRTTQDNSNNYANCSSNGRNSRGMGSNRAIKSGLGKDPYAIMYRQSFAVLHGETDETTLVELDRIEQKETNGRVDSTRVDSISGRSSY